MGEGEGVGLQPAGEQRDLSVTLISAHLTRQNGTLISAHPHRHTTLISAHLINTYT